jgi:hypothetical protein
MRRSQLSPPAVSAIIPLTTALFLSVVTDAGSVPELVKNNVAFSEVMVFQRVIPSSPESCKEQRPGSNGDLPL